VRLVLAGIGPQLRRGWRAVQGVLFVLAAWLVFGASLLAVFTTALIAPGRTTWNVAQRCMRFFFRLCRIPIAVQGLENLPASGAHVVAANHTSYMDGAVLVATLPWRNYAFVAKRELADNFFSRVLVKGIGGVFVERFDVQRSAEHADELVEAAKRGLSLVVFPEGTLMRQSGLMPFRAGAFQVAAQAGIPVVPVSLRGVRSVLRDETWYPRRAPIAATFGAPIAADGADWNAILRLRDRTRAEILKHCGEPDLAG
jgi:1-acyl-sn-glycerol-3-phosphate acyltransferase